MIFNFYLLCLKGLEIFEMLRPYDTLCELLAISQGSETDAVKNYFKNFTDNQACVACLTIICDQSLKNIKVYIYKSYYLKISYLIKYMFFYLFI